MPPILQSPEDDELQSPTLGAIESGIAEADEDPEEERREKAEADAVKALWKEYDTAREFDKRARAQYAVDRRYAAGTANLDWVVDANLIGSFIDILCSFLYARNPDVSCKKAPKIETTGTQSDDDFARTCELVVSALWRLPTTRLKDRVREQIRSTLSVGVGWLKATLVCKGTNIPEMKSQLNDARDNLQRLEALRLQVTIDENGNQVYMTEDNEVLSEADLNAKTQEYRTLEESVSKRMEVAVRKAMALDFVSAEDMQISLDVRDIRDHFNAGWNANRIYRTLDDAKALFPQIENEHWGKAKHFRQRSIRGVTDHGALSMDVQLTGLADESVRPEEADQYVAEDSAGGDLGEKSAPFVCIVELWKRTDGHVYTMVEGIDCQWAKQPYQPDYPTTRFFPYFQVAFYPVDGMRHPQSLPFRLRKLQDEYCAARSGLRRTRSRAVPGVIFNSGLVKPEDAKKLASSTEQELIGIDLDPNRSIRDVIAEKPYASVDMRLYDTAPIMQDLEKLSGVQEALQSSITTEKTATEAEIQQSGFAARTTADRDVTECTLTDLAHYTLEQALSALDAKDVQRICGAKAFWPEGMAIDDLLSMVEVGIEAGTTGKPKGSNDKQAWSAVLPILQASIDQIRQAQLMGDLPLATAKSELIKETMRRMGDESDVSRFLPQMPPGMPGMPGAPGAPGMGVPGPAMPGAPAGPMPGPMAPGGEVGAMEPSLADTLAPPELTPPDMMPLQ